MIGKHVLNPDKSASKAARISALADYIANPEARNKKEKCVYRGARGFFSDDPQTQKQEMIALAEAARKSADPIGHFVLSWRQDEQPTVEQIEEAVDIFLDETGMTGHQVIYALHHDTDNPHLHIMINRVNPETERTMKINRGFTIESVHRAVARIEHAQGWQQERHGRYAVGQDGDVIRKPPRKKRRDPGQRAKDMEQRTGEKSAEGIAIESGAPIIRRVETWDQLHRELAKIGMRYVLKGSGAIIWIGDQPIKASTAGRDCSLSALQKRLGVYKPPAGKIERLARETERLPEPAKPDMPGWKIYIQGRRTHYEQKTAEKTALDVRHERERKALYSRQRAQRDKILRGDWKGRGDRLNALRSVLAAEQAAEKVQLREKHARDRDRWRTRFRPWPDFEGWLRLKKQPELAELWRKRNTETPCIEGERDNRDDTPVPRDIRAYRSIIQGRWLLYCGETNDIAFVDTGKTIEVHDCRNDDSVLAALQLAAQKWGMFRVMGDSEYKALCVRLAATHGFRIANPELQEDIEHEREKIRRQRAQTRPRPAHVMSR
jgi:hypothetical protein